MTKEAARQVLVVEDDVSVRRPLVKFLEMHGFTVLTAETAKAWDAPLTSPIPNLSEECSGQLKGTENWRRYQPPVRCPSGGTGWS